MNTYPKQVIVVIGAGGMGVSIARRLGAGRRIVLADSSEARLRSVVELLSEEGHDLTPQVVDVGDKASVERLARESASAGTLQDIVHTAGVSPEQASPEQILRVDLLGTAHVMDEFLPHIAPGGTLTCIASIAGYRQPLSREDERQLAVTPTSELLRLPLLSRGPMDGRRAYHLAKRGNQVRAEHQAIGWGLRHARVNTVSPGTIMTPMLRDEMRGGNGAATRTLLHQSPVGRPGTPDDVASAVQFLTSPGASFITGTDVKVDGGVVAQRLWGSEDPAGTKPA